MATLLILYNLQFHGCCVLIDIGEARERGKLLKKGLSEKEIERLYIEHNNFKIIHTPVLYEANEFDIARSIFDNEDYFKKSQMTRTFNQVIVSPIPATSPRIAPHIEPVRNN